MIDANSVSPEEGYVLVRSLQTILVPSKSREKIRGDGDRMFVDVDLFRDGSLAAYSKTSL